MNKLKTALKNKQVTLGTWIQIGHPATAEILANAGFDWVCVDLEHGVISLDTMADLFRAIERYGSVPVVRIPANDPVWIHRSLDAGARGLIVPMIKSGREAEAAIREARYPPIGARGYGYSRANCYGTDFEEYVKTANDDIVVILQIEHIDAINSIDEILSLPDFDGTFIGPLDLAGSMGMADDLEAVEFQQTLDMYLQASRKQDRPPGIHIVRPDEDNIRKAIEDGYKMIALGLDVTFLEEMSKDRLSIAKSFVKNDQ